MIPALLLDVQPHHIVLDACSSPGSKTMQILEMIERVGLAAGLERGLVIANDADFDRCLTLTHQAKRAESPSLLITHGDASRFPRLDTGTDCLGSPRATVFDRILCDVPCSGDGILRKTPDGWRTWGIEKANELHGLQLAILRRALELVHVGGRVVYSTCALNPIENEAVIAAALNAFPGCVQLLDCSADLRSLKRRPGMSSWKLMHKLSAGKKELAEVSAESPAHVAAQMAPLAPPPNAAALALDRCMRIVPHDQNSSGFFVAVLLKTADLAEGPVDGGSAQAGVRQAEAEPPRKKGKEAYYSSSDVMRMLSPQELTSLRTHLCQFYGIDDRCAAPRLRTVGGLCCAVCTARVGCSFAFERLATTSESCSQIWVVSAPSARLLATPSARASLSIMHAGVKIMERREEIRGGRSAEDSVSGNTMFRIRQPGAAVLAPHMRKRLLVVSNDDFRFLLGNGSARFEELSAEVRPSFATRPPLRARPPPTRHPTHARTHGRL
jgi:16S rRNA C967 or C1407 C5-methylase (RsmB/RsmF family)